MTTVDLSAYAPRQQSVVYYRVTYSANSGTFLPHVNQWGRCGSGGTAFTADFSVTVNHDVIKEFGVNEPVYGYADYDALCDAIIASGAAWVRMGPTWGSIQTSNPNGYAPGTTQWNQTLDMTALGKLDEIVDRLTSHGVNILWLLCYTAPWASSQPTDPSAPYYEPADWSTWANYVNFISTRYKGKISYWEVWNEEDGGGSWKSGIPSYYTLLQTAAVQLRQVSASNRVVLGGLATQTAGVDNYGLNSFFDSLMGLATGSSRADNYFDILAYHAYGEVSRQANVYDGMTAVLDKYGLSGEDIWLTETGYSTAGDSTKEFIKANRVDRCGAGMELYPNIQKEFWYEFQDIPALSPPNLSEQNYGVMDIHRNPLNAYFNYQAWSGAKTAFATEENYASLMPNALALYYVPAATGDGSYVVDSGVNKNIPSGKYMYFQLNDLWLYDTNGGLDPVVYVDVTYLDASTASWSINYDGVSNSYTGVSCTRAGTGQWVTKTFTLSDAKFANRENYAADFRLYAGAQDLLVSRVVVRREFNPARAILQSSDRAKLIEHVVDTNSAHEAYNPVATMGGVECREIADNTHYFYFQVDPAFIQKDESYITIGVTFWDAGTDTLNVQYNATGSQYELAPIQKTNTNAWRYVTISISDAYFTHADSYYADFRISNGNDGSAEYVRSVEVTRND